MWLSRKNLFMLALFALISATYGCSNVEQASESGAAESSGAVSSADSVGSIPEDMLAQEEKAQSNETTESGENTESAENADPFSDLKESEQSSESAAPSDSMSVTEIEGDTSTAVSDSSGNMETYTVKAGDTLMKIAFNIYGDIDRWKDLQQWNTQIKKASALAKGMKIKYEAPLTPFEPDQHSHSYMIKKGDTLANIADEVYGRKAKYKKLQSYNSKLIHDPNRIFAGFTIFYDITAKEIAEAEARRNERMASNGSSSESQSLVPSAIAPPPAADLMAPAPIAVAPTPPPSGEVPAPASMNETPASPPMGDVAPPPPAAN